MKGTRTLSFLLAFVMLVSLVIPGTLAQPAKADDTDSGMLVNKTATANTDGTYTITLEAYATGAGIVIDEYKDIPTDIILVLDRSGSMKDDMGEVSFEQYRDSGTNYKTRNRDYYAVRHNGGSSNLWYRLDDGSYASVSVTTEEVMVYSELSESTTNSSYYNYANSLYEKVGDSYQKVNLTREWNFSFQNFDYNYYYSFYDQTQEYSEGSNEIPELGTHAPLYYYAPVESKTVYTYTYTDSSGNVVWIHTSTGADTQFQTPVLYERVVSSSGGDPRMKALKEAASAFVTAVGDKAQGDNKADPSDDVKHRLAVVSYASGSTNHTGGLLDMTSAANVSAANNAINGLTADGGTSIDAGISTANGIFAANEISADDTSGRRRVMIVFTDGAPGDYGDWGYSSCQTAANAISNAHTSKNTYGATVYTIGIFSGANASNPEYLPDYKTGFLGFPPGTSEQTGNTNRFMHLLSSNYPDAKSMTETGGLNSSLRGGSYYLSASDSETLSNIFQQIAKNIESGGSSSTLGNSAVVRDIISDQFELPRGTDISQITLKTYKYNGNGKWTDNHDTMGASAAIVGNQVKVTGFDFSNNWCGAVMYNGAVKEYRGNKLVISFTVVPKKGFLGGNDVPTNGEASGVYASESSNSPIEAFDVPTVNVPIVTPEFTVNNKTIYEGNSTAASGLYTLSDYTGDNAWKAAYVKIETSGFPAGETVSPADCTDYAVTVTYKPITDGSVSQSSDGGTPNAMTGESASNTATVHVLHPVVAATVNDVERFYGESYTLGSDAAGSITLDWADGVADHTSIPTVEGNAPYTKDDLHLEYSTTQFTGQSGTVPKNDFDVTVKVKKDAEVITGAAITTTCSVSSNCEASETDGKYTVHVKTCQLTITKTGGASGEPYVFTVNKDGGKYTEASITGDGSVTIYELPVGTYTIAEDTGWSWRYTPGYSDGGNGVALSKDATSGTITCTNTPTKNFWLNGFSTVVQNIFGVRH